MEGVEMVGILGEDLLVERLRFGEAAGCMEGAGLGEKSGDRGWVGHIKKV